VGGAGGRVILGDKGLEGVWLFWRRAGAWGSGSGMYP